MQLYVNELPKIDGDSFALTIGNYDGIHLGHQQVITRMKKLSPSSCGLISFDPSPSEILFPKNSVKKLCSFKQKIAQLESVGVDFVFTLEFNAEFAKQSALSFLEMVYAKIPFTHLILGYNAKFGRNREGDSELVKEIASKMGFHIEYVPPYTFEGLPVSSSRIRSCIKEGDLSKVEKMLGRPYSIVSNVIKGEGKGRTIGYPTANIDVDGLYLPPFGVWSVGVKFNHLLFRGIANLGFAPTVSKRNNPLLEVHIFDHEDLIYGNEVEIIFYQFIRKEMKFSTLQELKEQIDKDVLIAKSQKSPIILKNAVEHEKSSAKS